MHHQVRFMEKRAISKKENFKLNPINIYSKSKEIQENKLNMYLEFSKTRFLSLRFFTVFGEWGRPDMLIMKYLQSSLSNKNFFYIIMVIIIEILHI